MLQKKLDKTCRLFNVFLLITLFVLPSCDNKNDYPSIIIKNNLQDEYDFGKWVIYCSNFKQNKIICSDREIRGETIIRSSPVFYDLCLDDLTKFNDTTIYKFSFYIYDSIKCDEIRPYHYFNTIVFIGNPTNKIYRFSTFYEGSFCLNVKKIINYYNNDTLKDALNILYPYSKEEREFVHFIDSNRSVNGFNKWLLNYYDEKKQNKFNKLVVW